MNDRSRPKAAPETPAKASTQILADPADLTSDSTPVGFQPIPALTEADARRFTQEIREQLIEAGEGIRRASDELARLRSQQRVAVVDNSHVYFIQQGTDGPIKIGRANDVEARLRDLQTANPFRLRLLGVNLYGGATGERRIHRALADDRLQGEWFRPTQAVREVAALLSGSRA